METICKTAIKNGYKFNFNWVPPAPTHKGQEMYQKYVFFDSMFWKYLGLEDWEQTAPEFFIISLKKGFPNAIKWLEPQVK